MNLLSPQPPRYCPHRSYQCVRVCWHASAGCEPIFLFSSALDCKPHCRLSFYHYRFWQMTACDLPSWRPWKSEPPAVRNLWRYNRLPGRYPGAILLWAEYRRGLEGILQSHPSVAEYPCCATLIRTTPGPVPGWRWPCEFHQAVLRSQSEAPIDRLPLPRHRNRPPPRSFFPGILLPVEDYDLG